MLDFTLISLEVSGGEQRKRNHPFLMFTGVCENPRGRHQPPPQPEKHMCPSRPRLEVVKLRSAPEAHHTLKTEAETGCRWVC